VQVWFARCIHFELASTAVLLGFALTSGDTSPLAVVTMTASRMRKREVHFTSRSEILSIRVALVAIGFSFLYTVMP